MPTNIQTIKNFPALIKYLRTDLGWPVDEEDAESLTFDYEPEELGLDKDSAVKVRAAKQLRPLVSGQPWGIFWIDFEPKKLPVTVMRRILNQLVAKKRGGKSNQATWNLDDLLFISAVGSEKSDRREITFAHFHQEAGDLPTLRVLGWDGADTVLKIDYVAKTLKEKLLWPQNPKDVQGWRETWAEAFKHKPGHVIRTADALAARLAELAGKIRAAAETIMEHESERGRLRKLHKAFQTALIHDLTEADFADTYAQTITYGLLTAAISRTDMSGGEGGTALVAENITDMVPVTNPFLKEMLGTFLHAGGRSGNGRNGIDFDELGIQDVVELLRSDETDLPAILRDFNNRAEGEDPVIRFYEDFLEAYDKELKVQRGVFYTPKPVVSYIVRGVHELLQSEFGLEDGLAATATWGEMVARNAEVTCPKGVAANSFFVMILDPATGTATFLVEVIDVIYKTMVAKWKKQGKNAAQIQTAWNEYVPMSLLPRLYGYELMMAPYAIAHMKIGLKLGETGYRFASDQRANIYLTNALEEPSQLAQGSAASLFEALGHESQAVNDVKRGVHFTVVIGNPPYSGHSANASKNADGSFNFIGNLMLDYKRGYPELEKPAQAKWLQDDYVKFLRFSQWMIDKVGVGILAMITNHGYLDNPTFRGMREQLMKSFNQIYIFNLHGNSNKKETAPDGSKDENVFDIQQGVGISLMAKMFAKNDTCNVLVSDLYGLREYKYSRLSKNYIKDTGWEVIKPMEVSFAQFVVRNKELLDEYQAGWSLAELMNQNGDPAPGIVTTQDEFAISWSPKESKNKVRKLLATKTEKEARGLFTLCSQSQWNYLRAKKELANGEWEKEVAPIMYRPLDFRWTVYNSNVAVHRRERATRHFIEGQNYGLVTTRQTRDQWDALAVSTIIGHKAVAAYDINFLFPLYLYRIEKKGQKSFFDIDDGQSGIRRPNISPEFIQKFEQAINLKFIDDGTGDLRKTFGPEDVFHYMYAVFHSPTYRSRYAEFLKIDFPRLPLTSNVALFRPLCGLGKELVGLHLLDEKVIGKLVIGKFVNPITNHQLPIVAKGYPKYDDGKVYINAEAHFAGVPAEVWEFHIGGYQVCEKWLKDRRERELSAEDIVHYGKVVSALGETIRIMREVDEVIESAGGWPIK